MVKEITGRHVLFGFVVAFGVIISVNLVLAFNAVKTFPGLEVKNSYVASQQFNERKAAQEALNWTIDARHELGMLRLAILDKSGAPVRAETLDAVVGRATHVADDIQPDFQFDGVAYVAPMSLSEGNWNIRMTATAADGTVFAQRVVLHVVR
ncbi:MAG: FixH family protein [Thalassovita sp.]